MIIATKKFGEIEIDEDSIIYFPNGIIGFEQHTFFTVIKIDDFEPFCWLSATNGEELSLPVIDPLLVQSDYLSSLPHHLEGKVKSEYEHYQLFCVVNFNNIEGQVTINLRSPILIDWDTKTGKQLILESDDIPVAHPVL